MTNSILKKVADEAPRLQELTCRVLGHRVIPLGTIRPLLLEVLDLFFDRWRTDAGRINWNALCFLREVAWRVADPDPCGWCGGESAETGRFQGAFALAIEVERKLRSEASFVLERYRIESRIDGTMEELWIELLLCMGSSLVGGPSVALERIEKISDRSLQASLVSSADQVLGGHPFVVELLSQMAAQPQADFVPAVCRCLLVNRGVSADSVVLFPGSHARRFFMNCPRQPLLRLPDPHFFSVASAVIQEHQELDAGTFDLIIEGSEEFIATPGGLDTRTPLCWACWRFRSGETWSVSLPARQSHTLAKSIS